MEIWRLINTDTRIMFPIMKTDGTFITGATGLDSEWLIFGAHGAAAPAFADCTHEATEVGTTGIYYLDVSAAEINGVATLIQIKSSSAGAITQVIMIYTNPQDANLTTLLGTAMHTPTLAGVPYVDVHNWNGTAVSSPATAGIVEVNVKNIANAAVNVATAQLGVNVVNIGGTAQTANDNGADINDILTDTATIDTAGEIAAAVWNADATTYQTLGTFGQAIGDPVADTNTIFKAVVTDATGATVGVDVVAVKAELTDIHGTDLPAVKADTAAIITDVGLTHTHAAGAETQATAAVTAIGTVVNTGGVATIGAIMGDLANSAVVTRIAALKAETALIVADTNELQTRLANMIAADGADFQFTINALELAPAGGGGGTATIGNQELIIKILTGKWKILNNQLIMYDTDGTTPLYTFNLKQDGTATEFNPDERTPV